MLFRSYDINTYYPVVGTTIPYTGYHTFEINNHLTPNTAPSWSTHNNKGFTCNLSARMIAAGWCIVNYAFLGWIDIAAYKFCDKMPAYINQMLNSSYPVFYLRGGGKYYVYTDYDCEWSIKTDTYTNHYESVAPTTTPTNYFKLVNNWTTVSRITNAETKINQNSEAISLRATKTEVTEVKNTADAAKSTADAVKTDLESNYSTTTQMNSAIDLKADSITSTVSHTYLKSEDASKNYASSERVSNIESIVTQNANSITASFNSLKKQIDDKTEVVNAWITEGSDGTNPYLELGTNKSDLKTRLTNSELAFMDGTDKVAYISNNTMSITNADIDIAEINQLAIYPYQLAVKNGHLLIQYIGG